MFSISKEFHFSASHQLTDLPKEHPCQRLHGHNYRIVVRLTAPALDPHGFVRDYRELDVIKDYIDTTLDHRHLNDVFQESCVTAEYLAQHLFKKFKPLFPELIEVKVSETPKTWASYHP